MKSLPLRCYRPPELSPPAEPFALSPAPRCHPAVFELRPGFPWARPVFMALLPASVRCAEPRCRCPMPDALLGFPFWNLASVVVAVGVALAGGPSRLLRLPLRSRPLSAFAAASGPIASDFCVAPFAVAPCCALLRPDLRHLPRRHVRRVNDRLRTSLCFAAKDVNPWSPRWSLRPLLSLRAALPGFGALPSPPHRIGGLPMVCPRSSCRPSGPSGSRHRRFRIVGLPLFFVRSAARLRPSARTVVAGCPALRFQRSSSPGLSRHSGGGSLPPALPVPDPMLQHCLTGVTLSSSASSPPSDSRCRSPSCVENPRRFRDALSDCLRAAEVFSDGLLARCPAPRSSKSHAPACAGEVVGNLDIRRFPGLCRPKRRYAPRPFMGPLRPCLVIPLLRSDPCAPRSSGLASPCPFASRPWVRVQLRLAGVAGWFPRGGVRPVRIAASVPVVSAARCLRYFRRSLRSAVASVLPASHRLRCPILPAATVPRLSVRSALLPGSSCPCRSHLGLRPAR